MHPPFNLLIFKQWKKVNESVKSPVFPLVFPWHLIQIQNIFHYFEILPFLIVYVFLFCWTILYIDIDISKENFAKSTSAVQCRLKPIHSLRRKTREFLLEISRQKKTNLLFVWRQPSRVTSPLKAHSWQGSAGGWKCKLFYFIEAKAELHGEMFSFV